VAWVTVRKMLPAIAATVIAVMGHEQVLGWVHIDAPIAVLSDLGLGMLLFLAGLPAPPARPCEVPDHPAAMMSLMPTAASSRRSRWRLRARVGPMLPTGMPSLADASA